MRGHRGSTGAATSFAAKCISAGGQLIMPMATDTPIWECNSTVVDMRLRQADPSFLFSRSWPGNGWPGNNATDSLSFRALRRAGARNRIASFHYHRSMAHDPWDFSRYFCDRKLCSRTVFIDVDRCRERVGISSLCYVNASRVNRFIEIYEGLKRDLQRLRTRWAWNRITVLCMFAFLFVLLPWSFLPLTFVYFCFQGKDIF